MTIQSLLEQKLREKLSHALNEERKRVASTLFCEEEAVNPQGKIGQTAPQPAANKGEQRAKKAEKVQKATADLQKKQMSAAKSKNPGKANSQVAIQRAKLALARVQLTGMNEARTPEQINKSIEGHEAQLKHLHSEDPTKHPQGSAYVYIHGNAMKHHKRMLSKHKLELKRATGA